MPISLKRAKLINELVNRPRGLKRSGDRYFDMFRKVMLDKTGAGGFCGFRNVLRPLDEDRQQRLTPPDIVEALGKFGVLYYEKDISALFERIDLEKNNYLSMKEFIQGVSPRMNMHVRSVVLAAFKLLDKKQRGAVPLSVLNCLFDPSQHPDVIAEKRTQQEIMEEFLHTWGKENCYDDEMITMEDFLTYYNDLGADMDEDYLELLVRNCWHVSGGEGACRNTSCMRVNVHFMDGRIQLIELKDDLHYSRDEERSIPGRLSAMGLSEVERIEHDPEY